MWGTAFQEQHVRCVFFWYPPVALESINMDDNRPVGKAFFGGSNENA